jgi:hypothetical protein
MELRENYLRPSADPSMGWHSFFILNPQPKKIEKSKKDSLF